MLVGLDGGIVIVFWDGVVGPLSLSLSLSLGGLNGCLHTRERLEFFSFPRRIRSRGILPVLRTVSFGDFRETQIPLNSNEASQPSSDALGRSAQSTVASRGRSDLSDLVSTPSDTNAGLGLLCLVSSARLSESMQEKPVAHAWLSYLFQMAQRPRDPPQGTLAGGTGRSQQVQKSGTSIRALAWPRKQRMTAPLPIPF